MAEPTRSEVAETLGDDGCAHRRIVPSKRYEDGSIDGRCADCGEEGFPIRDVGYEMSMRADAVEAAELRGVPCVTRERYMDPVVEELACEVLGMAGERLPMEGETERVYRLLTELDRKLGSDTLQRMRETTAALEVALVALHRKS